MDVIPKGSKVRQIVPVIEGEITQTRFDESTQALEYHVAFTNAEGEPAARWFKQHEVEAA